MEKAAGSPVKKKILLIFAKVPVPGMTKTRLCPPLSLDEAAMLYEAMLGDTLEATAALSGVERWLCYAPSPAATAYFRAVAPELHQLPQEGADLGERLSTAFSTAFAHGADQVAIIGSDAPDLPTIWIAQAFALLDLAKTDVVYGPTTDGGYYLVGMKRLWQELFNKIPWSSATALQASLDRSAALGISTALLPEWHDVDTYPDLERLSAPPDQALRTHTVLARLGLSP